MDGATTHILRASLRPKLYRDIEIDSGKSLYDLAEGIVRAFDFDLDHAFGFYSRLTGWCPKLGVCGGLRQIGRMRYRLRK